MKNKRLKSLTLKCGIHTLSIRSKSHPKNITERLINCGVNTHFQEDVQTKEQKYCTKINPNHYGGKINSLVDFDRTMEAIMNDLGILFYNTVRVDFSLDNFEPDSYDRYLKITKWVVLMFAMDHDTNSLYETFDPMTFKKHSIKMDSQYFQIEFYDKYEESHGTSPVQSRLEFRSKRLSKTRHSVLDEINLWVTRLRNLPSWSKYFQNVCNDLLLKRWKIESSSGEVRSISEFIRKYQGNIFTDKQLIDLSIMLGSTEKYAREVKAKTKIETYKEADLKEFTEMLIEEFINFTAGNKKT